MSKTTKNEEPYDGILDEQAETFAHLNLWQRINHVRDECTPVAKDKEVGSGNFAYKVATHEDLNKMLRPLLVKYGLVDFVSIHERSIVDTGKKQGQKLLPVLRYEGQYIYTVQNIDAPDDNVAILVEGHGEDAGDKGPGKATTYALKTGRSKMFSVTTGEDEEGRIAEEQIQQPKLEVLTDEQADYLIEMVDTYWGDDGEEFLKRFGEHILQNTYGVASIIEIPRRHYEHALKQLENQAKRDGKVEVDGTL